VVTPTYVVRAFIDLMLIRRQAEADRAERQRREANRAR
jgi:hypothetical protein